MAEAAAPERQMKRALSAFDLTCLGIGAIIGAGIFALAGTAAAGEHALAVGSLWKTPVLNFIISYLTHADLVFGRPGAGPAVVFSFIVAAIACGFAALCYAELAAMIPVSGSAYTYSYATLGQYGRGGRLVWLFCQTLRQPFWDKISALGGVRL